MPGRTGAWAPRRTSTLGVISPRNRRESIGRVAGSCFELPVGWSLVLPSAVWSCVAKRERPWAGGRRAAAGAAPGKVFAISFIFSLIAATLFALWLGPSPPLETALKAGALAGFGFVAASFGINYQFAQRSFKLWLIDGGYHGVQFVLFGLILGLWHDALRVKVSAPSGNPQRPADGFLRRACDRGTASAARRCKACAQDCWDSPMCCMTTRLHWKLHPSKTTVHSCQESNFGVWACNDARSHQLAGAAAETNASRRSTAECCQSSAPCASCSYQGATRRVWSTELCCFRDLVLPAVRLSVTANTWGDAE